MSCCDFGSSLHYVSPAHGGWGVVRVAALIPESHMLFVAPFACGRHGALGGEINGIKDRISYLYIDEGDIISGGYEDLIPDAVNELFGFLEKRPKVLVLFVTCLDDLLGTDHVQLQRRLRERHPDVRFISCHMNPISMDTKFPPGVTLQNNIYSLLEKREQRVDAINLIGNNVPISRDCELFKIMADNGYSVRHITDFESFEGFLTMAESRLNLRLSQPAKYACEQMEKNLGIKCIDALATYDIDEIKGFYSALGSALGFTPDTAKYEESARCETERALSIIGDCPIALDYQAVKKPYTLAKALLRYGFNVRLIMADGLGAIEKGAYEYIKQEHPEIKILNAIHPDQVKFESRGEDCLCIGFDCGYATGSDRVVDLMDDETLFGFRGLEMLMKSMVKAYESSGNLKAMIDDAGLVV